MRTEGQKQSKKHEVRLAKEIGGQRSAGSGSFWSRKGDVRSALYLLEHKWTGKKSFTLKSSELEKIHKEAVLDSRVPLFGVHLNGQNYLLISEDNFLELFYRLTGTAYESMQQMQTDLSGE